MGRLDNSGCRCSSLPKPYTQDCEAGYAIARVVLLAHMYRLEAAGLWAPDLQFMLARFDEIHQVRGPRVRTRTHTRSLCSPPPPPLATRLHRR